MASYDFLRLLRIGGQFSAHQRNQVLADSIERHAGFFPIRSRPIRYVLLRPGNLFLHPTTEPIDQVFFVLRLLFGAEAIKQFFSLHFLFSFQMRDGFINGHNQFSRPAKFL